jgi:hypothetical protein
MTTFNFTYIIPFKYTDDRFLTLEKVLKNIKDSNLNCEVIVIEQGLEPILPNKSIITDENYIFMSNPLPFNKSWSLKRLNKVIYHPAYNHMFSDCELFLNCKDLGMIINGYHDGIQFLHVHHSAGLRQPDQADQQYHLKWQVDQETWNKRKLLSLEKRLEV